MYIDRVVYGSIMEKGYFKKICFHVKKWETEQFKPLVAIQFSLTSLIKLKEIPKEFLEDWNPQWSSVDFLVYDSELGVPILVVEFHGRKYHSSNSAMMRDDFKRVLFERARISYVMFHKGETTELWKFLHTIMEKYREKVYG